MNIKITVLDMFNRVARILNKVVITGKAVKSDIARMMKYLLRISMRVPGFYDLDRYFDGKAISPSRKFAMLRMHITRMIKLGLVRGE